MDRYTKIKKVGHGLFSEVYSARLANPTTATGGIDVKSNDTSLVALKITIPEDERPPHNSKNELRILNKIQENKSPNKKYIISLLDTFTHSAEEFELILVLPYLQYNLHSVLHSHRKAKYPRGWHNKLPVRRSYEIILEICKGLEFLHDECGIIHRDIKPENILFDSLTGQPVIIDFGISWIGPDNNCTEPPSNKITDVGTTVYRAPELLFGITSYSSAIDMWALGCVASLMFSYDGMNMFEPYKGELALFCSQTEILGAPTVETWPEIAGIDSFTHMNFNSNPLPNLACRVPLAPDEFVPVISGLLTFESTQRTTASKLRKLLEQFLSGL
ncbi:cyclin-dependent protein kinase-activating kinase CAK1 [Sugiyamaella lignohabitans]|uniref:Cyclin-dependent protein kinase-activating kinase CAK1 n=1 Tax=Sugiyamaella lignohabitans TaxID=796027 RepID=A0A167DNF8_9ASCO|nr:cyclin-dependent protein kinase-activating kinase CAK1 [Sugiyamaella lignohabitans]ANB13103.1 cyclin-dependent protein kinase-activating kinase CAK1 [Sugiyamaella lignohabitans]